MNVSELQKRRLIDALKERYEIVDIESDFQRIGMKYLLPNGIIVGRSHMAHNKVHNMAEFLDILDENNIAIGHDSNSCGEALEEMIGALQISSDGNEHMLLIHGDFKPTHKQLISLMDLSKVTECDGSFKFLSQGKTPIDINVKDVTPDKLKSGFSSLSESKGSKIG